MTETNNNPEAECVFTFRLSKAMSDGIAVVAKRWHLSKTQVVKKSIRDLFRVYNASDKAEPDVF